MEASFQYLLSVSDGLVVSFMCSITNHHHRSGGRSGGNGGRFNHQPQPGREVAEEALSPLKRKYIFAPHLVFCGWRKKPFEHCLELA